MRSRTSNENLHSIRRPTFGTPRPTIACERSFTFAEPQAEHGLIQQNHANMQVAVPEKFEHSRDFEELATKDRPRASSI